MYGVADFCMQIQIIRHHKTKQFEMSSKVDFMRIQKCYHIQI